MLFRSFKYGLNRVKENNLYRLWIIYYRIVVKDVCFEFNNKSKNE